MTPPAVSRLVSWVLRGVLPPEQADEVQGDLEERARRQQLSPWRASRLAWATAASVVWFATVERLRGGRDRRVWGGCAMIPGRADFTLAWRRWKGRPTLALTAVFTLALGLAATTAIFSILDTVVLRGLPWRDAQQLHDLYVARPHWRQDPVLSGSWNRGNLSFPIVRDVAGKATTLDGVGAWNSDGQILGGAEAELVRVLSASSGLLPVLGVSPAQGRFFTADEDEVPSDSLIVSYETWQHRYGGRSDILGQPVILNETPYRIIGVLPRGFRFGTTDRPEFIRPLGLTPVNQRSANNHFLNGIVRLADGVSVEEATRQLDPWVRGEEPAAEKQARLASHVEGQLGPNRQPLQMLFAAAGLLLLIAASNVGALLLGDVHARRHEFAIRAALGSGRRQFWRQMLAEALLLAAVAGTAAVGLAGWALPALLELAPTAIPRLDTVSVDLRVLAFTLTATLGLAMAIGALPAWSIGAADPAEALREGGRDGALQTSRAFRWVVAAQVALALVLVVGAGLLVETVRRKSSLPLGFDADRLAVVSLRLPPVAGATAPQRAQRVQALVDHLQTMPGVQVATATSTAPFSNSGGSSSFQVPAKTFGERDPSANRHIVTERYFEVMGMRPIKGRVFDATDQSGAFAAVVTDQFEQTFLDGHAVGRQFTLNGNTHTVVGVVASPKHRRYTDEAWRGFYLLGRQLPMWPTPTLMVRTAGDPGALLPELRRVILAAEPGTAFYSVQTMESMLGRSIAEERYRAQLAGGFGVLALLLAALGLYGVTARAVQARTREWGVRLALGARPGAVSALVFRHALGLGALGVVLGLPAAWLAANAIGAFLYGVAPFSPLVVAAAVAAIVLATGAAAVGPAVRASRIDPLRALRD